MKRYTVTFAFRQTKVTSPSVIIEVEVWAMDALEAMTDAAEKLAPLVAESKMWKVESVS